MLRYALLVTGPAYGSEQAASALLFARALLAAGHQLISVFFYREGVANGNQFTLPANDEYDLVRAWAELADEHNIPLNICVAAALRRGVVDAHEAAQHQLPASNLHPAFTLSGLGALAEAALSCDRLVQF